MLGRLGLVLGAIVASLLVLELGLRLWASPDYLTHWDNLVLNARAHIGVTEAERFVHDDRLGYVPKAGFRGNDNPPPASDARPVLALGDSYTWGEEVTERETWPAHLERLMGRRVINGGVNGYGFDQSVLRAEMLVRETKPAIVVVSFIADDIRRTEMSRLWGAEKPYFDLAGSGLALRNVPVPPRPDAWTTMNFWQRTLGYSYLVDFVLRRLGLLHNWFGDHVRVHPEGQGVAISCRLAERLAALKRDTGVPVLLLAQYDPVIWQEKVPFASEQRRLVGELMKCAGANGLSVVDSFDALAKRRAEMSRLYVTWHMSDAGNRLTAELVGEALAKRRDLQ